ncbi:MAG TPA: hypothetical protein VHU44_17880, partial [Acidobacteriaceae bacterium]|nr:hypothetical protein [Acidobacteriaceae bacterium]
FNALLKTLEEPPDHIVFMMATTQPEDIPQTVRSRCQHFSFHAVKLTDILGQLRSIAHTEDVAADDTALALLAEAGDGSMRDALSIMDQAIASAPTEDGRARLDGAQIRELMGTVSNTVFERVMEAVDGNRSAEVMTVANELLDAGNSPVQLARQCVRYLRNALIARIAGITPENVDSGTLGSELLQISPDEQRRVARTAALFSEEELTRFLNIMLRTFDELGYRQEQRFHLELGLLKLVHLRRLLPIEEVLSQTSGGTRSALSTARPAASASRASVSTATSPAAPARSAFSPFEADKNRRPVETMVSNPIPASQVPTPPVAEIHGTAAVAPHPRPRVIVPENRPAPIPRAILEPVAESIDEAASAASAPTSASAESGSAEEARRHAIAALRNAKQSSAADAMEDAVWTMADGEARIQTELSKVMLPVLMNAEAEKILRAAALKAGVLRLTLLPGIPPAVSAKKPKTARVGSVQAKAQEHPMVQQAQKLFQAEIQTVIDLREGE